MKCEGRNFNSANKKNQANFGYDLWFIFQKGHDHM